MRLDHLLSKEHFSRHAHTGGSVVLAETVSDAYVIRRTLMGGTLTDSSRVSIGRHDWLARGYIGTLLGPERTRECFSGQDNDKAGSSVIPQGFPLAGAEFGFGFVCCLRTAQWTRASLLVSV